jgi:putative transposase
MVTPAARREAVHFFRDERGLSERTACEMAGLSRSTYRRKSLRSEADEPLRERLLELASERPRYGYRRLYVFLRREGWRINRKRVYRVYRELGLAVRRKRRKRAAQANRQPRVVPIAANLQWSMDFMRDTLSSGRVFRTLNVVDDATRECLAIEVDTSLSGARAGRVLDAIARERGAYPKRLVLDNGPECTSRALDQWAYERGVELAFIRPGKPVENCFVESFNGKFRDECLNLHWFLSLEDARRLIEAWRLDYNYVRPHSGLGDVPPALAARGAGLRPTALQSTSAPPPPPTLKARAGGR